MTYLDVKVIDENIVLLNIQQARRRGTREPLQRRMPGHMSRFFEVAPREEFVGKPFPCGRVVERVLDEVKGEDEVRVRAGYLVFGDVDRAWEVFLRQSEF